MPILTPKRRSGNAAEQRASEYLVAQGLNLSDRNYQCRQGEIDLIMQDGSTLVFVEVRYRKSRQFGGAAASVTLSKQRRIIAAANHFLQSKFGSKTPACRFDVLAIEDKEPHNIHWIQDAFQADY